MSRIDASVATQVGDTSRARQVAQDVRLQADVVRVSTLKQAEAGTRSAGADEVGAAAAQLKQVIETASTRRLGFAVYDKSGELYVEVTDQETGELVKQIPGEAVLQMRDRLAEMIGVFVDERA